ncbi:unnamed protein product [Notodromas monacha]|uniref:RUN and FYVE domain-containing protein 4 n=1 Tax=Notodromas monacha TaxID=399045 RepID=A0A7R9BHK9_9CRUS|nr:unnamed protein product [Notodromas monacha]CAG0914596.1 unnamed protein product [Notodromas monacha]
MANSPSSVNGHESALNTALLKAISDCGDCIHKLKDDFVDSGYPITDDNTSLHRLSAKLEFLLQAHMKVRTGVLGKKRDYWDYMLRCLARRHVHDGIKFVKACPEYKTSLGRGRALLRFCLVHQCLADTIQQCVTDGETTSACYKSCSPLLRQELSSDLLDSLYILNEVKFDLNPTGHDLDVAWPTFSKTCGAGMLHWRPPSRTMSISSLDSSFSSYENGGALSSSLSEVHERNEEELMEYRMQVADLRATIEDLKSENRSLKRAAEKSTVHAALQTDQELVGDINALKLKNANLKKVSQTLQEKLSSFELLLERTEKQNAALRKVAEMGQELAKARAQQLSELRASISHPKNDSQCQTDLTECDISIGVEQIEKLRHALDLSKEIGRLKSEENEALKEQLRCAPLLNTNAQPRDVCIVEMDRQVCALKEALKLSKQLLALRTEETEALKRDLQEVADKVAADKSACSEMNSALLHEAKSRKIEQEEAKKKIFALEEALALTKKVLSAKAGKNLECSSISTQTGEDGNLRLDLERSHVRSSFARSINEDCARQFDDMRVEFKLRKALSAEEPLTPQPDEASIDPAKEDLFKPKDDCVLENRKEARLRKLEAACRDLHAHLATNADKSIALDNSLARIIKMASPTGVESPLLSSPDIVVTEASQFQEPAFEQGERVQENSERIMEQDNQILSLRASMEARDAEMRTLSVTNSTLCEEIENLRIQLASQAEDYSRVLLASEEAQNELVRLAAHVTEQQKIIEELESRFGDFEGDRSAELNQSMKLNESLQEELAEKIALALDLERRVKKYSSAVSGLRDSFRTISRELLAIGAARATSVKGSPSSGPKDLWSMGEELSSKNSVNISDENDNDLDVIVGIESKVRWLVNSIQKHIGDFDSDNKLLREGLVHLLKEKDRLWQLNNRFVQLFRQLMRNDWADDDSASNCESCGASFSLMLRRHHCRLCGKFFCFSCSDYSVSLATTRGRNRVCRHCFALVQKIRLDVNSSIALEELESTVGDDEPSEEVQIEPLFRPVNVGFVESAAPIVTCARPTSIGGTPPAGEEKFTVITGGEIASIRAEVAECPTYISCPSKLSETVMLADLVHCEEEGTPGNVRSLSKEGSFEDSDDWRQNNGRRGSDSNFQHSVEFWVTAKTSFGVPVSLPIHPCVLAWKVDTQAQMDLNFAVTYRTTGHVGSTECLHPIQRLLSGSCRGQLKIKRSGIYTFVFDNTFSSFKAKKVSLKLRLEKDQSSPGTPASSTTED